MKAIEIAGRNHVTMDDMMEVCRELEIACESEESELLEKDIFLIEKKIEAIKKRKARQIEDSKKGRKIKLKRKVQMPKEGKEGAEAPAAEAPRKTAPRQAPKQVPRPGEERRTAAGRAPLKRAPGARPAAKEGERPRPAGAPRRDGDKTAGEKPAAAAVEGKDKKRKKTKEKDKDKRKYKKEHEEKEITLRKRGQEEKRREAAAPSEINITESISVGELAKKLNIKAAEVIAKLMKLGVMATINQIIDSETAEILAGEYGAGVKVVSLYDQTVIKHIEDDRPEDHISRPPVVTVMGHVDHGKTKLLDAIRQTNIIDGEFGGITQHIGAYGVTVGGKKITFLDTPGHEAFTTMRARGAKVTDIVVLIVAANDGVMPQTIEAINHAKDAGVPIIVAINKIDLADANPEKVKHELAKYDLVQESWGGQTLFAEISAKFAQNLDGLMELILIQSEIMEFKANPKLLAKGTVIESKLDMGRGAVSTVLIQNGTLRVGDPFVIGVFSGKVRAMFDDLGQPISEAGPSTPVEVLGISGVPSAGDPFEGVDSDKTARQISQRRLEYKRVESAKKVKKVTLESLNEMIRDGEMQEIRIIVKADVDGSCQALKESLEKLSTEEVRVKVIHTGTGGINESDVMLASASNALIIGYHVRPTGKVSEVAERENVSIKFYNVIFEVTDHIKAAMEGMLSPEIREEVTGSGSVKQVFKISKVGSIAGAILESGKVERTSKMRLIRDGVVVFDGAMKSLKRFKDDVSEVVAGQEFGFGLEGFNDIKEGDAFESYRLVEIAKTIQ
ncbi:MAG: translation initiation factor IF-2 [Spirochaetes bacterium]|nr:translation initiation factor IF-2 [Spirochaetota bacterium]